MKSLFFLLDHSGKCPGELYYLLKALGELQDRAGTEHFAQQAQATLTAYDAYAGMHDTVFASLNPAPLASITERWNARIANIKAGIQINPLSAGDFHEIRKSIRHLMNVFQTAAVLGNEESKTIFIILHTIAHRMGKLHDIAIREALEGAQPYEEQQLTIPPDCLQALLSYLDIR